MPIKRCLIFSNYDLRPTDGGPSGFLGQNLRGSHSEYYQLGESQGQVPASLWGRLGRRYSQFKHRRALRNNGLPLDCFYEKWSIGARRIFLREKAGEFPCVWFHDIWTMAACLDLIQPPQRIILQSHCPELPSEEASNQGLKEADVEWTRSAERRAFARANVCVFPNAGSQTSYSSLLGPNSRVEYLLSGSQGLKTRFSLPLDTKYIYYLYIGRRIAIKGFDIVIDAFRRAYDSDSSLRLLLVGNGDVVQHPGVIDLGRSEEPGNWIAACDYFVSSNRSSYFDLSVMEALSLGTPLIIACTGGHDYYAELSSPGIIPIPESTVELLTEAILSNRRKRTPESPSGEANRRIFYEALSSERYRINLDNLLKRLLAE